MKTVLLFIKKHIFPLSLIGIWAVLVCQNYTYGTFLSGWDTLHPEFNLPLAFSRIFTGVWRPDQGLGTTAIQSHMAELPRLLYLWCASLVLPASLLRYSYFFLMLLAGPLGMYALMKRLLGNHAAKTAFIGALMYLCNFATVQQFIVPLEMFATQYGLLPWLLLVMLDILHAPSKKRLLWLAILSFVAGAQAHTATLLYAYLTEIFLMLGVYLAIHRQHVGTYVKRVAAIIAVMLATNLYIILPNMYAAAAHGLEVSESKVNRLFSPEAFAKTQAYGTPINAAIAKNFLFNWQLYDYQTHQFAPVLGPWVTFADNPWVVATGYSVFALSLVGIVLAWKKKRTVLISLTPLFFVSFLMLINGTWPMPKLFDLLGSVAPVVHEALRFPFTKFSILYIAGVSIFASYAVEIFIHSILHQTLYKRLFTILICASLLFSFLPAFEGYLIQPAMRIRIPNEYFDMFHWFQAQPADGRVAILPIHSFWNWTYYRWGYQGAGFLQFGIPQPILDRDYDRWSPYNEQYEKDLSYAVYSQNPTNIRTTLAKYNVSWVLVDNSVFAPASNENQTLLWLLPDLLARAGLTKVNTFGNDITVYRATSRPLIAGYTNLPSQESLNPYMALLDKNERVKENIPGTLIADLSGRTYVATNTPTLDHIDLPALDHARDYLLEITSVHTLGFPLELCVSNALTSHCDLYVHLGSQQGTITERFLLPKLDDFGIGYSLDFNNFTIQGMTSVNQLSRIRVLTLPSINTHVTDQAATAIPQRVSEILPTLYRVTITSPVTSLVFNESFEAGWIAIQNGKLLPHTKVSGWANAWSGNFGTNDIIETSGSIYIIFLPQLLEWIGFALLPVGVYAAIKTI